MLILLIFFNEIDYIITFKDRRGNVEKAWKNTTNFVLPLSLLRPEVQVFIETFAGLMSRGREESF